MAGDLKHCVGCRDDFYNIGYGKAMSINGAGCSSLAKAKVVTRYKLGWWTTPDTPGAFTKVRTNSCHHAPGRYVMQEHLPSFAVDVREAK